jgi:hypothetical protein
MLIGGLIVAVLVGFAYGVWEDTPTGRRDAQRVRLAYSIVFVALGIILAASVVVMVVCLAFGFGREHLAGNAFRPEIARLLAGCAFAPVALLIGIHGIRTFRRNSAARGSATEVVQQTS